MPRDDLIAVFSDPDAAEDAVHVLHGDGITDARVASPAPFPVLHHTGEPGPWRALGWVALFGGLTGLVSAIAFEVITSNSMNLIVGGKPILSWTAFGVIMFEMTMLFAGAATFATVIVLAAFTRRRLSRKARAQVTSDRIVVVVPTEGCSEQRKEEIRRSLSGAVEVLS